MMNFRTFFEETKEEEENIKDTLKNVPKRHASLIKGFKFIFHKGNTINGDDEHVGIIDFNKKTVTLAGPWRYPREFTFLHELGHQVWAMFVTAKLKKEWKKLAKKTKNKVNQNAEELFCHAYANTYSNNKILIHNHPEWEKFIKNLNEDYSWQPLGQSHANSNLAGVTSDTSGSNFIRGAYGDHGQPQNPITYKLKMDIEKEYRGIIPHTVIKGKIQHIDPNRNPIIVILNNGTFYISPDAYKRIKPKTGDNIEATLQKRSSDKSINPAKIMDLKIV